MKRFSNDIKEKTNMATDDSKINATEMDVKKTEMESTVNNDCHKEEKPIKINIFVDSTNKKINTGQQHKHELTEKYPIQKGICDCSVPVKETVDCDFIQDEPLLTVIKTEKEDEPADLNVVLTLESVNIDVKEEPDELSNIGDIKEQENIDIKDEIAMENMNKTYDLGGPEVDIKQTKRNYPTDATSVMNKSSMEGEECGKTIEMVRTQPGILGAFHRKPRVNDFKGKIDSTMINKHLIGKKDSVGTSGTQILNKAEIVAIQKINKCECKLPNLETNAVNNQIDLKEASSVGLKNKEAIARPEKLSTNSEINSEHDNKNVPVVSNDNTNDFEIQQAGNLTSNDKTTTNDTQSTNEETSNKRSAESSSDFDAEEDMSLKALINLYSEDLGQEMGAVAKPFEWQTPSLEDTHLDIPENEDKNHVCEHCNEKFATEYDITIHACTKKPSTDFSSFNRTLKKGRLLTPNPFDDEVDDAKLKSSNANKVKAVRRGIDVDPCICPICKKSFCRRSGLKIHIRRHMKEMPYKCEYCNKGFVVLYDLDRHVVQHIGEKRFRQICEICRQPFVSKSGLIQHKKAAHSGFGAYICEICNMRFSQEHRLKKHLAEHEEKKAIDESLELMESMEASKANAIDTKTVGGYMCSDDDLLEVDFNDSNITNDDTESILLEEIEVEMIELNQSGVEDNLMESTNSNINEAVIPSNEIIMESVNQPNKLDEPVKMQQLSTTSGKNEMIDNPPYVTIPAIKLISSNQLKLINLNPEILTNIQPLTESSVKIIPANQIQLFQPLVIKDKSAQITNVAATVLTTQHVPSSEVQIEFIDLKQKTNATDCTVEPNLTSEVSLELVDLYKSSDESQSVSVDLNKFRTADESSISIPSNEIETVDVNEPSIGEQSPQFIEVSEAEAMDISTDFIPADFIPSPEIDIDAVDFDLNQLSVQTESIVLEANQADVNYTNDNFLELTDEIVSEILADEMVSEIAAGVEIVNEDEGQEEQIINLNPSLILNGTIEVVDVIPDPTNSGPIEASNINPPDNVPY